MTNGEIHRLYQSQLDYVPNVELDVVLLYGFEPFFLHIIATEHENH